MAAKKRARKRQSKKLTAVDIAKDVLALINTKKIKPTQHIYLELGAANTNNFAGGSLQDAIQSDKFKACEVCGIGSMFMAFVDKNNEVDIPEDYSDNDRWSPDDIASRDFMSEKLAPYISHNQLDLIEWAFEEEEGGSNNERIDFVIYEWSKQYKTPKAKLIAICENMIANKGIFRPTIEMTADWK